jgi:hypothetical protein
VEVLKACKTIKHIIYCDNANPKAADTLQQQGITLYPFAEISQRVCIFFCASRKCN